MGMFTRATRRRTVVINKLAGESLSLSIVPMLPLGYLVLAVLDSSPCKTKIVTNDLIVEIDGIEMLGLAPGDMPAVIALLSASTRVEIVVADEVTRPWERALRGLMGVVIVVLVLKACSYFSFAAVVPNDQLEVVNEL
jgi:hypothetical protein